MSRFKQLQGKRNQGFTLVELIIVVAIIAVLSAVLVPQYIQYMEKSRIGADEAYIQEVAHSLSVVHAANPKIFDVPVTVTFDTAGKIQGCSAASGAAETEAEVDAELLTLFPSDNQKFVSDYYTTNGGVTLVLYSTSAVTISGTKNINT